MSLYTFYVDPVSGVDSPGHGGTGSPCQTINYVLQTAATLVARDILNIAVRPPAGAFSDLIELIESKHGGTTINIYPDVPGTPININRGMQALSLVYCDNSGSNNLATPCYLNIKHFNYLDTVGWLSAWIGGNSNSALRVYLEDCTGALNGVSNPNSSVVRFGSTPTTNAPTVTLRRCSFINFGGWISALMLGNVVIEDCTFTSNVCNGFETFYIHRYTKFIARNNQITRTDAGGTAIFNNAPQDCTDIVWENNQANCRQGVFSGDMFSIDQFDPATPTSVACNVSFLKNRITIDNTGGRVLHLGQEDNQGLSREAQAALMVNRFGQVIVTDNDLINTAGTTGSGILIGLGVDGQDKSYTAIVRRNFVYDGPPVETTFGHCVNLSGDGILYEYNVSVGFLGGVIFGNNVTFRQNTSHVYSSAVQIGHTGGGTWRESANSIIKDNILVATAPASANSGNVGVSGDYTWNGEYITVEVTAVFDRNLYWATNASPCPIIRINDTNCSTIAEAQAIWSAGWGSHPDNDQSSISVNPEFVNTSILSKEGYRPLSRWALRADGSYFGAVRPNPVDVNGFPTVSAISVTNPPGYIALNHDYGGTDSLTIESNGIPLGGATIRVFVKSQYDANPLSATIVGSSTSDVNGRWIEPVFVPPPDSDNPVVYAIVVSAIGNDTLEVGVTV